jgi:uncharacterized SAM-binding protein YcdF (DUF218 family)
VFFIASKIFWMLASPIDLLLFGALIGVLLCFGPYVRFGRALALAAVLILAAAATLPVGMLLIAPLEDRFPPPPADLKSPEGFIVLGGAIDDEASAARGGDRIRRGRRTADRGHYSRQAISAGADRLYRRQRIINGGDVHGGA